MRSEAEMSALILDYAKADERVRAVVLNGSRANPNAPKDRYQDYDIVYVVRDFASFTADHRWIDVFGERLILQMPEAMRNPSGRGHFSWMMLFADGNRLDLTLIPAEKPWLLGNDSESVALLDKDGLLPAFPAPSDKDYWEKPPDALCFHSCCNNFWWCLQNVAKGIARRELPYAMMMFHGVVREELHEMIAWQIGAKNNFSVSAGKMGKYFQKLLPPELYAKYVKTYSDSREDHLWEAVFAACDLFRALAGEVARALGCPYHGQEDENVTSYLKRVELESAGGNTQGLTSFGRKWIIRRSRSPILNARGGLTDERHHHYHRQRVRQRRPGDRRTSGQGAGRPLLRQGADRPRGQEKRHERGDFLRHR